MHCFYLRCKKFIARSKQREEINTLISKIWWDNLQKVTYAISAKDILLRWKMILLLFMTCQKNKYNLKQVAKANLSRDDASYEDSVPKLKARNFIEDLIEEEHSSRDYEEKMTLKIKEGSSSKEAKEN